MSTFREISPILPMDLLLIWWITSNARRTLSMIEQSSTKVGCSSEMILGQRGFRRLAMTFEMILQGILERETDLKSFMDMRLFIFGISAMMLLFIYGGKEPVSSQAVLELKSSGPHICQFFFFFFVKSQVKAVLSKFIWNRAFLNSSIVKDARSETL